MLKKSTLEDIISKDLAAIWAILTPDERRLVADNFHIHNFKKNQIIYAEKDSPRYLWCLLKGKVKLSKDGMGGRQQILRLYRPIQYFGYRAFFANEPYVSSASAFEASTLGAIPMSLVKELIDQNRKLAWFFINELSKNLGGSDAKIVNLTQKHIRGRLADAIIALVDNYGYEDDGETLKIYMAREDLANLSNMTTSNAIRTLSSFCQEHILTVDGRRIKILNPEALRNISKFGKINDNIISRLPIDDKVKAEVKDWYESLIKMMELEHVKEKGHLQINKNVLIRLNDLHAQLLKSPKFPQYGAQFYQTLPYIVELRSKSKPEEQVGELETCFNALYGILMLRLQGKEISEGTQKAVAQISYFIGMLAAYYKKDEEKPLFEDDVE